MRILGFEWDAVNIAKLALHDLDPDDVETLFDAGEPAFFGIPRARAGGSRWVMFPMNGSSS
jgi:hypothetical protein